MDRMNREQFFAKLTPLGEDELRKALWNLYWRGSKQVRERIESELQPPEAKRRLRAPEPPPDPGSVKWRVDDFVELARAGAYIGGDRRVSPKQRTRWRSEFKQLIVDARDALRADDDKDFAVAAGGMELLLDLACEMRDRDYFRSEDPIGAARVVVSDEVALLWRRVRDQLGFAAFAERAAPQLIRWESEYGWTRHGDGATAEKETSLTTVLEQMLQAPDAWSTFAGRYLDALDQVAPADRPKGRRTWSSESPEWRRKQRARRLARWHALLLDRLDEVDDLLDRLVAHPAIEGPEVTFVKAQLAHRRGWADRARALMGECLAELPAHREFIRFAQEIGVPPSRIRSG